MNYDNRFGGIGRLFGATKFSKLHASHVCVIGIGGVGSWAAEALVRSGVGNITLIDMDEVCVTNSNRQLHALNSTVGQEKVKVMEKRLLDINPELKIKTIIDFLTADTANDLITKEYDLVIDAIDTLKNKCIIINECRQKNIPVITCGAAGGKQDPTKIQVDDLGNAFNDNLLQRLRKKLRRDFNFPKGKDSNMGIISVFSHERVFIPNECGEVSQTDVPTRNIKLDCFTGLGSATFVTGSFGFSAAYAAIEILGNKND